MTKNGKSKPNRVQAKPKGGAIQISRGPVSAGFPENMDVRLNYVSLHSVAATTGGLATSYVYRLNDTYDPDFSGGGHQPMFRDQLFALYEQAVVYQARVEVHYTTSSTVPLWTNCQVTRASAVANDITESMERGEALQPIAVTAAMPGKKVVDVDVAERFGVSRITLLSDDLYSQGNGASPTNQLYFNVSVTDPSGGTNVLFLLTKITMTVRFKRLKEVGQS